jgi:hypothetical protein
MGRTSRLKSIVLDPSALRHSDCGDNTTKAKDSQSRRSIMVLRSMQQEQQPILAS